MFAIVDHKNKQYRVTVGQTLNIDLDSEISEKTVKFENVLLFSDEKSTKVGDPTIKGAVVEAEVLGEIKDEKVKISKFHAKKHYQRNNGHRQKYVEIKISSIKA